MAISFFLALLSLLEISSAEDAYGGGDPWFAAAEDSESKGQSQVCQVAKCCDTKQFLEQTAGKPSEQTCSKLSSFCHMMKCGKGDSEDEEGDDYNGLNKQTVELQAVTLPTRKSSTMSTGETALIIVGASLVILIVAALGFSSWRSENRKQVENEELYEGLTNEDGEKRSFRRDESNNRALTILTGISCIFAVIALIVASVALSDKPTTSTNTASGNNLESIPQASTSDSTAQLRTGQYKVKLASQIGGHPFCAQSMQYFVSCQELQSDLHSLIHSIGDNESTVEETMANVAAGSAGNRVFVASNQTILAASPQLAVLNSKVNQSHDLMSTASCEEYLPFEHQICLSVFRDETNRTALVAFVFPNTQSRSRRNWFSNTANQLSSNWHGSWSGGERAVEDGAISGAEHGALHGAIAGGIAGLAGGPMGAVTGAIGGALSGAVHGGIEGGISGGESYVKSQAMNDLETTGSQDLGKW